MKKIITLIFIFGVLFQLNAQNNDGPSPILFIYDASGSMWGQIQHKPKMVIAQKVLSASLDNLPTDQKIGFVAYGHRSKEDCKDVEFLVDFRNGTKSEVIQTLKRIKPLGITPLAYSARLVIDKLRKAKQKATIILITDGIESCDGNICEVIKAATQEGIDFKLLIIGFGLKDENTDQLKCAASAGNGNYYNAENAEDLSKVLNKATTSNIDDSKENMR